jgi:hypothetical protein
MRIIFRTQSGRLSGSDRQFRIDDELRPEGANEVDRRQAIHRRIA